MSETLTGFKAMDSSSDSKGESRLVRVLLVDTSSAMSGVPIRQLNQALLRIGDFLNTEKNIGNIADICVISFNSNVEEKVPFCPASNCTMPTLSAGGKASMNKAIIKGLDVIEERIQAYRRSGCLCCCPEIYLLTNGEPTDQDMEEEAKYRLKQALGGDIQFFPVGIGDEVNYAHLESYIEDGEGTVLKVQAEALDAFARLFIWRYEDMLGYPNTGTACLPIGPWKPINHKQEITLI